MTVGLARCLKRQLPKAKAECNYSKAAQDDVTHRVQGLEAAIKLAPFGETSSLLRLLDLLLPPVTQAPKTLQTPQTPRPRAPLLRLKGPEFWRPDALKAPALRRLALELATRLFSEPPIALTSEAPVTSAKGPTSEQIGVGEADFREIYQRVADVAIANETPDGTDGMGGTDGTDGIGGMDGCLLAALRSTERALLESAYETVGVSVSGKAPSSSGDRPIGPLSDNGPMGSVSHNRPIGADAHFQSGGLLLSSDLAKATPTALIRTYVERPTETRAEILRILVRDSPEHRAEFGAQLSRRSGDNSAAEKLRLVAPVEEYLRAVTGEGSAETEGAEGAENSETEHSGDVATVAKLYLGLVTEYLVNPETIFSEIASEGRLRKDSGSEGPGTAVNGGSVDRRGAKRKPEEGELFTKGHEPGKEDANGKKERTSKKRKMNGLNTQSKTELEDATSVLGLGEGLDPMGEAKPIRNAVELFRCCSALVPLSAKERSRLLRKLLPKGGLGFGGLTASGVLSTTAENGVAGSGPEEDDNGARTRIGAAHCLQQAAVARLLILHSGKVGERGGNGPESTDDAPTSSDGQPDAKQLLRYAQTLMTSLTSLHRSQGGSAGDTERVKARLEEGLLALLAEAAGYLSGLTDKFAAAVASFVESVLRWRFADVGSLTVAQLLLTAIQQSTEKAGLESGLAESAAEGVTPMEEGEAAAEVGSANGVIVGGVLGEQKPSKVTQKVAEMGARLFDLVVSHSQFVPTLLASRAGASSPNQNPKPLPHALGKHSGDFVPSSLASILSLLDTPPLPMGLEKGTAQEPAKKSEGFANAEASASRTIEELLYGSPLPSVNEAGLSLATSQHLRSKQGKLPSSSSALASVTSAPPNSTQSEVVQLLTVLLGLRNSHAKPRSDTDARSLDDLLSLLLAAYGATMSDVDRRILHLMRQIDGQEGARGLVGMDYLWGERALRSRQERKLSGEERFPFCAKATLRRLWGFRFCLS